MKHALVTGGSRGIGRAVAVTLAAAGYHVLVNYKSNEQEARETLRAISAGEGTGELMPFDVARVEEVNTALEAWTERHEGEYIEVLVNNAGIREDNLLFWMTDREWHDVMGTNMHGVFHVTRFLVKYMMNRKHGRIINVVSVSGVNGMAGQTNYSTAKAGIIGFTRSLALETARKGVTVNAVAPGFIDTDMTQELDREALARIIPAGRLGKASEVAALVGFLASEEAAYITGEVITISGGM